MLKKITLDNTDKDILFALDKNARKSIAAISNETGIQRDTIKYRIKRLENSEVISFYHPIMNPQALGYPLYVSLYIKINDVSQELKNKFVTYVNANPHIIYGATTKGSFDFVLGVVAKDLGHYSSILKELKNKLVNFPAMYEQSIFIQEYQSGTITKVFLGDEYVKKHSHPPTSEHHYTQCNDTPKLDKKDKRIVEALNKNGRLLIKNISKITNIQRNSVHYRLNRLEKLGVIRFYHTLLNPSIVGFTYHAYVHFSFKEETIKSEQEFINFLATFHNVVYIGTFVGRWDIRIYTVCQDKNEFDTLMEKIKWSFPALLGEIESAEIIEEFKYYQMAGLIK